MPATDDELVELIRSTIEGSKFWSSVEYHVAAALRENPEVVLRALGMVPHLPAGEVGPGCWWKAAK